MIRVIDNLKKVPLSWRLALAAKLVFDFALTGAFYIEQSITMFWSLVLVVIAVLLFLGMNVVYLHRHRRRQWLPHLLLLDFIVSAACGYGYMSGNFPNHVFIGITALAILVFAKSARMLVMSCILLLAVYLVTMIGIDWYVFRKLDAAGYLISCSFILFAGIASAVIQHYQRARDEANQLYAQLIRSHEQLREYALRTEELAATRERVRIARDIHDAVGHNLTALLVQMQLARKLNVSEPLRSRHIYLECEQLIQSSLQEVRLSVRAIRDEPAGDADLPDSLRKLCADFAKWTGVQTEFELNGVPVALPRNLQLTAYRIAQEALTNAQKHGGAKHARVSLSYSASDFALRIRNDGVVPDELTPGFGLVGLQERTKEWNGQMRIHADRHDGFAIEGIFPYAAAVRGRVAL
ncbi:signal transduction histidine kinase [Paenibacillus methanolicus]|uniref:histidine kinase n=1 Tax=Paenibacillus methanolicus TaxID=582686 RepID=A0A5S5C8E8_9BACL|nr:signal transduction histidine kinase [Paenibacillus methanolicus]